MASPQASFVESVRPGCVVVLGTGGTIAGTAADPGQHHAYRSAQLGVDALVAAVPALAQVPLETEQVAQVDSKDMSVQVWGRLWKRLCHHLARPDVAGVVVTHGTDTLEETAVFLDLALGARAAQRAVVLTAAMRPATSSQADGPGNLADAVAVARWSQSRGVLAVMGGQVWRGTDVRKVHGHRLEAFSGGDAPPLAQVSQGRPQALREWPVPSPAQQQVTPDRLLDPSAWPWVEIVTSHAGASERGVRAWVAAGVQGLVVAGTGNGTVHQALEQALLEAQAAGVAVWRSTRCVAGGWVSGDAATPTQDEGAGDEGPDDAGDFRRSAWTPAQARVALQWQIMSRRGSA